MKIPRNAPCPCGSGKKFKKCHLLVWQQVNEPDTRHQIPHRLVPELTPLPEVSQALEEAHVFWHDAVASYQDPDRFRATVNGLIQAARNVTFRLQNSKNLVPSFDQWYEGGWQPFLSSHKELWWLNQARVQIVHKAGLESRSKARVSLVWSHAEPHAHEMELPPLLPTDELVEMAVANVPKELLGNSVVEIERRWEVDDLPGVELLDALAECVRVLMALVQDLRDQLTQPDGSTPADLAAQTALPECLWRSEESRRVRVNPATGERYIHETITGRAYDSATLERVAKKYKVEPLASGVNGEDPIEYARAILPHATKVLRIDGYHIPILMLHRPEGGWQNQIFWAGDRLEKYLLWKKAASEVRDQGYDGLIYIGEGWIAPAEDVPNQPYPEISRVPGRQEVLSITAAAADGRRLQIHVPFRKRLGRVMTGEPEEMIIHGGGFLSPIERVWGREKGQGTGPGTDVSMEGRLQEPGS